MLRFKILQNLQEFLHGVVAMLDHRGGLETEGRHMLLSIVFTYDL